MCTSIFRHILDSKVGQYDHSFKIHSMAGNAEIIIITPNIQIPRTDHNSEFAVTKDY